jgi:hypothetical protein
MHAVVTRSAQCNQILLAVIAGAASKIFMVHLKVGLSAANLATPPIALEHLITETIVLVGIEPHGRAFRSDSSHDAFSVTYCRNVCFSSPGRNLKNRNADCKRTMESSFSRFAPAKKSAQIISRQ